MKSALLLALLVTSPVLAGPLDPPSAPAPTPGPEARQVFTALPATIEAPGSYLLTGNLTASGEGDGIVILADNVTLDLNGFTLRGDPGALAGTAITASSEGGEPLINITIRNGIISNWAGSGIDLFGNTAQVQVHDLNVEGCGAHGIRLGEDSIARACIATDNGESGIAVGQGSLVETSISAGNGGNGIAASAGSTTRGSTSWDNSSQGIVAGGTIAGCTSSANGSTGITAFDYTQVSRCLVNDNSGIGIFGDNTSIAECRIARANSGGIDAGDLSTVIDTAIATTSVFNSGDGILITSDSSVTDCSVRGYSNGIGISAQGSDNQIVGNHLIDNDVMIDLGSTFLFGPFGNIVHDNSFTLWRTGQRVVEGPNASGNSTGPIYGPGSMELDTDPRANFRGGSSVQ